MVRRQKRLVNELRREVVSERKLETLRTLRGKSVNKRLPVGHRDPEGQLVKDQSCWGTLIHEHFGAKFRRVAVQSHEATRALWKARLRRAQQLGENLKIYRSMNSGEVLLLVKPNVATGRDNIPGTIVRFLPEFVLNQLYRAIADRLSVGRMPGFTAGQNSISVWSRRKVTFRGCVIGILFRWFPHCTKCMKCVCGRFWTKISDHSESVGGVQARHAVPGHCFPSWWRHCGKPTSGEKSCSLSPWMW